MRLYRAICAWLEASAQAMASDQEPRPEGSTSQAEHAHSYTTAPELHVAYSSQSIDDDDGARHRPRRVGFAPNPER